MSKKYMVWDTTRGKPILSTDKIAEAREKYGESDRANTAIYVRLAKDKSKPKPKPKGYKGPCGSFILDPQTAKRNKEINAKYSKKK